MKFARINTFHNSNMLIYVCLCETHIHTEKKYTFDGAGIWWNHFVVAFGVAFVAKDHVLFVIRVFFLYLIKYTRAGTIIATEMNNSSSIYIRRAMCVIHYSYMYMYSYNTTQCAVHLASRFLSTLLPLLLLLFFCCFQQNCGNMGSKLRIFK